MKKRAPFLALALLVCAAGCHSTYDITLRDGVKVTAIGKWKYDRVNEVIRYKDIKGVEHAVPAGSVRVIEAR
jgi:hypothetical protein